MVEVAATVVVGTVVVVVVTIQYSPDIASNRFSQANGFLVPQFKSFQAPGFFASIWPMDMQNSCPL